MKNKTAFESSSSKLFICFTSSLSRSSSKSLLMSSPSLSSRLRSTGVHSPSMFATKKKTSSFDPPEPSSPKVTCIGQVRVKSKKKKLKANNLMVNRSRSVRFFAGEANFGRKHVLNCFVPCGWSGCRGGGEEREKMRGSQSKSCGGVFVRWLMQESVEEEVVVVEKGREFVGLVVEERGGSEMGLFAREEEMVEEEEEGRVSLCIPPRNALLLMRCRSDPMRMAALSNRSWELPMMKVECEEEEEEEEKDEKNEEVVVVVEEVSEVKEEVEENCLDVEEAEQEVVVDEGKVEDEKKAVVVIDEEVKEEGVFLAERPQVEAMVVDEPMENEALCARRGGEEVEIILRGAIGCYAYKSSEFSELKEGGKRRSFSYRRHSCSTEREARRHNVCSEKEARRCCFSTEKDGKRRWSFSVEK